MHQVFVKMITEGVQHSSVPVPVPVLGAGC